MLLILLSVKKARESEGGEAYVVGLPVRIRPKLLKGSGSVRLSRVKLKKKRKKVVDSVALKNIFITSPTMIQNKWRL